MPKDASTSKELFSIAKATLQNPDYEVGPIQRMVINSDKVKREKDTSDATFDKIDVSLSGTVTLTGTQTTYHYEWEQFQVATAEQVGDTYYIFYNTLKRFTSGASTTPLNRWIVSGRIQGREIPKANIDKGEKSAEPRSSAKRNEQPLPRKTAAAISNQATLPLALCIEARFSFRLSPTQ